MAKFNKKISHSHKPDSITYEGASAYSRKTIDAWLNFIFSSYLENTYYESSQNQFEKFIKLTEKVAEEYGYSFVAKACIFARKELGMRSISQLTAAWLNDKSFQEKRQFYKSFVRRPDDISEIFSAIDIFNQKRSHALVKGCADKLSSFDEYKIMKYRMTGHKYNMYDIVNLCHPKSPVITAFKNNKLDIPDVWESKVMSASNKEERQNTWLRLVNEHKLEYMALIKNLNNILEAAHSLENPTRWIVDVLCPQINNKHAIKKSLIFPYRIYNAYKNLKYQESFVISALESAFIKATENVPTLNGRNLIVLDVSGSMRDKISMHSNITLSEVGACFALTLALGSKDTDIIKFGSKAKSFTIDNNISPFQNINNMVNNDRLGYGTVIERVLDIVKYNHDLYSRVFVISDMQIFDTNNLYYFNNSYASILERWNKYFKNIKTYSFDLSNYSNQISPPSDNFIFLTSLNDNLFKFISFDNTNIVDVINNINFIS